MGRFGWNGCRLRLLEWMRNGRHNSTAWCGTGAEKEAIRFLEKTRKMSQQEARMEVAKTRIKLGML